MSQKEAIEDFTVLVNALNRLPSSDEKRTGLKIAEKYLALAKTEDRPAPKPTPKASTTGGFTKVGDVTKAKVEKADEETD